jgi:hypothetical protein
MAANPDDNPRRDTRGLPEGYDPRMLYEYRFSKLKENSTGLESWLYKYIPYSVIKSFAVAIDPTYKFKVAPGAITPENRLKYRATASVLQVRTVTTEHSRSSYATFPPNYNGVGGCWGPGIKELRDPTYSTTQFVQKQDALADTLEDTTSKTRLWNSTQGTMTKFKGTLNSPPRSCEVSQYNSSTFSGPPPGPNDNCIAVGGANFYRDGGSEVYKWSVKPSGAVLSHNRLDFIKQREIDYNIGLIQANVVEMLKGYSPQNRDYTLFRNVVELKDIRQSVLQLQDSLSSLSKLFTSLGTQPKLRSSIFDLKETASKIPGEYLSFHFGWKQTYNDLLELVMLPGKMSKRLNFLIARAGKPTTFRSSRKFVSGENGISAFDYDYGYEYDIAVESRIVRESELRLVVNATFDFPPIDSPRFRFNYFMDRIGLIPRPTDIYNLIPWTWLVDYFTGLGNYVECIDNLNRDPNLINWGMITCDSTGKYVTQLTSKSQRTIYSYANGIGGVINGFHPNNHSSVYDFECQTRRDVSTALDVNATSIESSLSSYQKSIIGALLLQRSFSGKRGFTASS